MEIPEVVRLLLVEGSKETSYFIKDVLKHMKYSKVIIDHVETLKEAKEFNKDNIDIVLLDLVLPNSEGIKTFQDLIEHCSDIPVIIISEFDDLGCQAVREGAQDFLPPQDLLTSGLLIRSIKYAIERKRLEDEKYKLRGLYKEIVESTHAAIYEICFRKDRLTYVNDVMIQLTGWSREELMNMSVSNLLTEDSKVLWLKRYEQMIKGGRVSNTVEYEVNVKDGTTRWVLITASYKFDENGNPAGARVIALDVTDKKLAQMEAKFKEQLVYNELEKRLMTWRQQTTVNRQIQVQQLKDMNTRIMSINNGIG